MNAKIIAIGSVIIPNSIFFQNLIFNIETIRVIFRIKLHIIIMQNANFKLIVGYTNLVNAGIAIYNVINKRYKSIRFMFFSTFLLTIR